MQEYTFKTHVELAESAKSRKSGKKIAEDFGKQFEDFATAYDDMHPWDVMAVFDAMLASYDLEIERGIFPDGMPECETSYFRIVERTDECEPPVKDEPTVPYLTLVE